ncbi:hypothetical protein D3C87_1590630 [compost metagenome]
MSWAYLIAARPASESEGLPQLALMTLAPWSTAQMMASVEAPSVVWPEPLKIRTGKSLQPGAIPVTPKPLSCRAPMMPATWVPWP